MTSDLQGRVAVITGGGGAICGEIAAVLARAGASVAILDISLPAAEEQARGIRDAGGSAIALKCDATDRAAITKAVDAVLAEHGTVDILVNGAGGSLRQATTSPDLGFFDIDTPSLLKGIGLNYTSAVVPSQVVGRIFAERKQGVIVNISSIAGICPLTRAVAYSNAKAAVNSFTQWLAVHMAQHYSTKIRVNAIAPGFVLTGQNRFLLVDEKTGEITERGRKILSSVPMGRYGRPEEIAAAALWLVSDSASFVTGAVIPVDGGFTACSGV